MTDENRETSTDETPAVLEEGNESAPDDIAVVPTPEDIGADDEQEPTLRVSESPDQCPEPAREHDAAEREDQAAAQEEEPLPEGPDPEEQAPEEQAPEEQAAEEQEAVADEQAPTVESVIEAILFASDEPLTDARLAGIVETTAKQVRQSVKQLNEQYDSSNRAFRIEQIAGGYQMLTLNMYNHWLKKMLRTRSDTKLSPAALETLAIIAYKQPIIRADVEAIRGVAVGEVIRSLMYKGLVRIAGRAEVLGRPMLYGTTKKFLELFGLNSLKDLPKAEELKNPDR